MFLAEFGLKLIYFKLRFFHSVVQEVIGEVNETETFKEIGFDPNFSHKYQPFDL